MVGHGFAERALSGVFALDVLRQRLVARHAVGDAAVEFVDIAALGFQQILDIVRPVAGEFVRIDQRVVIDIRVVAADALGERRADVVEMDEIAPVALAAGERAAGSVVVASALPMGCVGRATGSCLAPWPAVGCFRHPTPDGPDSNRAGDVPVRAASAHRSVN